MKRYYDDYDFEEAFQKQLENVEEFEQRARIRRMMGIAYRTTTTTAGDLVEVDIYPAFRDRHDMPRTRRGRESRPSQKALNDRRARRRLMQLIETNFGQGDLWCTWTFDKDHLPETIEEAEHRFMLFIRRVNRKRKALGLENVKYIAVTECGEDKNGTHRAHVHAVMSGDMDRDLLESMWTYGRWNHTRRLVPDQDSGLAGMASYISKDPRGRRRWKRSRNLKEPVVTRSYTKFSRKAAESMAIDAGELERQIGKKYSGLKLLEYSVRINDINAGCYIYARMRRVKETTKRQRE